MDLKFQLFPVIPHLGGFIEKIWLFESSGKLPDNDLKYGNKKNPWKNQESFDSRDDKIRTCDPLHPMQVRYRAALRPETYLTSYRNERAAKVRLLGSVRNWIFEPPLLCRDTVGHSR